MPLCEVGLEAAREAQRLRLVCAREPGHALAAVDAVARIRRRLAPRLGEVVVRSDALVGRAPQHERHRALVALRCRHRARQRIERRLDLERQVRGLLRRVAHALAVLEHPLQIALADPVLRLGAREVARRAPDQRRVLVEDARVERAPARRDRSRRVEHHVGDEEARVHVLAQVREIEGRVEERELVPCGIAPREDADRVRLRGARAADPRSRSQERAELLRDLALARFRSSDPRHDAGLEPRHPAPSCAARPRRASTGRV